VLNSLLLLLLLLSLFIRDIKYMQKFAAKLKNLFL